MFQLSPVTFDTWMQRKFPACPFERYADDAIIHCNSEDQARKVLDMLRQRFAECKLELHPQKTKIVYCKDANRKGNCTEQKFDFLGHTFRPRGARNRSGELFVSFAPAISAKAIKAMRLVLHRWKLPHRGDLALDELVKRLQPVVRGWINYYGRFCPSVLYRALNMLDELVVCWARRKYKWLKRHATRAWNWLERLKSRQPALLPHWQLAAKVGR